MKRSFNILTLVLVAGLFWGCSSSKGTGTKALKEQQFVKLKELVASRLFVFSAEAAYPMQSYAVLQVNNALFRNTGNTAGRIDLAGNGDFIKVEGDTIQAELAYFGEVRIVSSLDPRDSGINFKDVPYTYEVNENEKKQTVRLKFDVKEKSERFSVVMELYPNKNATVLVNCLNRTPIRYEGVLKVIEE